MVSIKPYVLRSSVLSVVLFLHMKQVSCIGLTFGGPHKALACEWEEVVLICREGQIIEVTDVLYGRDSHLTCYNPSNTLTTNCSEPSALSTVRETCDGRMTCRVQSSYILFGDPCWGTSKYLEVFYNCTADTQEATAEGTAVTTSSSPSVTTTSSEQGDVFEELACEWDEVVLACEEEDGMAGGSIHVLDVLWGRDNQLTCHIAGYSLTTDCSSDTAHSEVSTRCEGRSTCRVQASYQVLGEPCSGTVKYLLVRYNCTDSSPDNVSQISTEATTISMSPPSRSISRNLDTVAEHTVLACEQDEVALLCEGEQPYIEVMDAFYGRDGHHICHNPDYTLTTNCSASHVLDIVRGRCDTRSSCRLSASNSLFGEPCAGTLKYLQITYNCTDRPQLGALHKNLACEHSNLVLMCEDEKVIGVVDAFYGRDDYHKCHNPEYTLTTNCSRPNTVDIVRRLCDSRAICRVPASNRMFGEPCSGTHKYLEVTYHCTGLADTTTPRLSDITTADDNNGILSNFNTVSRTIESVGTQETPGSLLHSSSTSVISEISNISDTNNAITYSPETITDNSTEHFSHSAQYLSVTPDVSTQKLMESTSYPSVQSTDISNASSFTASHSVESSTLKLTTETVDAHTSHSIMELTDNIAMETVTITTYLSKVSTVHQKLSSPKPYPNAMQVSEGSTVLPTKTAAGHINVTSASHKKDIQVKTGQVDSEPNTVSKPAIAIVAVLACFVIIVIISIYVYRRGRVKHRPNIIYLGKGANLMQSHDLDGQAASQYTLVEL